MQRYRLARWAHNRKASKKRQQELASFRRRVNRIIKNSKTEKKSLIDFPAVYEYLSTKFPDVDLSDIRVYIAPPEVIQQRGWPQIGGFFVKETKDIFVKDEIRGAKSKGRFDKIMKMLCPIDVAVEDVVVHEFIHVISHKIGRASSRFEHMEEEFVYANCIGFYKEKGMSEEDIVNSQLLPFCTNDVFQSYKSMSSIFHEIGVSMSDVEHLDEKEFQQFCNKHAEVLVPAIKIKAQTRGNSMIELYRQFGQEMEMTSEAMVIDNPVAARFASLELGDDL